MMFHNSVIWHWRKACEAFSVQAVRLWKSILLNHLIYRKRLSSVSITLTSTFHKDYETMHWEIITNLYASHSLHQVYLPDWLFSPKYVGNRLLRAHFLISVKHTVWIRYHNGPDQCRQPLALSAEAPMKKNFWSWVPTDRPWALYPLKANSHSACLNISAQPLPSHSHHALEPLLLPLHLPLALSLTLPSPSIELRSCRPAARVGGWVGCRCRAGWIVRGGESSIVGLDSTLSPLEHPLMGEPTDNHTS